MKKICAISLILCMLTIAARLVAADDIHVIIDGKPLAFDVAPRNLNGRIYVPLRAIFEEMGAAIEWDDKTLTVTAEKDDTVVILTIGDHSPTINGQVIPLDQPAIIADGRTLAPLRFVAEAFGGIVEWDTAGNTASITQKQGDSLGKHSITIQFPAYYNEKDEHNASVFEIDPFEISLAFPGRWTLVERGSNAIFDQDIALSGVWSIIDIYNENRKRVGAIGYNAFTNAEAKEDNPQAIFNQIALGNDYRFDVRNSYRIVKETVHGTTAVTDVYYGSSINDGKEKINKGIVFYNRGLLVYIAIELDDELVSEAEWYSIAQSIELSSFGKELNPKLKSMAGYIAIDGNQLFLDEVEVILLEDVNRITELGLIPERDMPNGYDILPLDKDTMTFRLTDETVYTFVDYNLLYIDDLDGDRIYSTTDKEEFIKHLTTSYHDSPPAQKIPFFIQVQGDKAIRVTERFAYTI